MRSLFVTGTDTGVGKTVIACALVRGLSALGARVEVMKPVASGASRTALGLRNADALELMSAARTETPYEQVNPYCFEPAVSPHIAAEEAGIEVDIGTIVSNYRLMASRADWVVIEGAGGWLAPVSGRHTMADLALALEAPVLLVVGVRLGCLNHAQLTRDAIGARGVSFAGWIGCAAQAPMQREQQNVAALARLLKEPPLASVPHSQAPTALVLESVAARLAARTLSN